MVSQDKVSIVTLLTDFGLSDTYVGVMKGVILSRLASARLVDLTHDVAPQEVVNGAFLLQTAWRYFPSGSIHLAVVDPGVGSDRRRLAMRSEGHSFVGPDNGLLSAALPDEVRGQRASGQPYELRLVTLPAGIDAVAISATGDISATFEGRDVFAPAAAYLAGGGELSQLGDTLSQVYAFPAFRAPSHNGQVDGLILHRDRFGNLISDIRGEDLPPNPVFTIAGLTVQLATTYAAATGPSAIVSSSGFVEVAMPDGSAALVLGAGPGDTLVAQPG